jgi:rhodanese-related sulfurtransferase
VKNILPLLIILAVLAATPLFAVSVPVMNKDELKSLLGSENLVILDVRSEPDWSAGEFKIKDAVRVDNGNLSIVRNYPKNSIFVLYCA